MIIKNLSRKNTGTSTLLRYIFRYILNEDKRSHSMDKKESRPFILRHNIRTNTIEGYIKEFERVQKMRVKRKNQIVINHAILSWTKDDASKISDKMLRDIAKKFISLRSQSSLFVGTKHNDKDHIHIHLAYSPCDITGRSNRITKQQFADLKLELDAYQKVKYPELISLPQHGLSKSNRGLHKTGIHEIKPGSLNQKDSLRQLIVQTKGNSKSLDELLTRIKESGHQPYYRNGTLAGIKYEGERKFRLSNLGLTDIENFEQRTVEVQQEKELQELRTIRNRTKIIEQEREPAELIRELETDRELIPSDIEMSDLFEGYGVFPRKSNSERV
jgi:Relaxase/Mobilisation nuclease domain